MGKKHFSPQESLALIESMIQKAQNKFAENGHLYLLWGWTVFVCSFLQFVLLHFFQYQYHYRIWGITWLVAIYQMIYLKRKKRERTVKTYYDEVIGYVWISFVAAMFLIGYAISNTGSMFSAYYTLFTPCILVLYGIPVFLSGILLRFKPLTIGGVGCWIISFVASTSLTKIPYDYQLLFIPITMLVAWIVPGYLMRKKYLQTN
ncbi:hypothetical protein ACFOW1_10975 [Parasediminibacterium paludis]|uniref:Uncharacterized protein n=1 Tax=Parasediminibacterium paludis TaxID=908966 RepID=A0ABV8PZM4_9BACT